MIRAAINFYFLVLLFSSVQSFAQNDDAHAFQSLYDSAKKNRSIDQGKLALNFALEKEEDAWIAKSYFLMAFYQKKNSKYSEALKNYFAALKYYKYAGNPERQVNTLNNIGIIYMKAGFLDKSLSFYEDAQEILDQNTGTKIKTRLHYNYARALGEIGNHEAAEKLFMTALDEFKEIDDKRYIKNTYLELGKNNVLAERYKEAKKYYALAVEVFPEGSSEYENTLLKKLNSFGYMAIMEGKLDNSLNTLQSALQLSTNADQNKGVLSDIYENLGRIYKDRNQVDSAVLMYAKSVEMGDFYAYDRNYIQTCEYLYRHYYQNDDSRAIDYHDTIYKFGDELATLQKQLNHEHIRYQVEAANYRREAELRYLAHQAEKRFSYAAYGFAVLLIASIVYYFLRKEYARARRARVLLNSIKYN